ncbi:MAG: radical SAM protein, partial [Candidatus Omnitrophota bacterium]
GRPLCGPILGTFLVTYRCNYRCKMCNFPQRCRYFQEKGWPELPTGEMKKILVDFAGLGVSGIGFTGGEPLLRDDIFELMRFAKDLGMITHLNTNGFFLDEKNAWNTLSAGVDSLNISLDGANPQTHDTIRGCPGAFDKAVRAIECMRRMRGDKKHAIRIKVVMTLGKLNIDEVPRVVELAGKLGADCVELIPEQPFAEQPDSSEKGFDELFLEKVKKTAAYLLETKPRQIKIENSPRHIKLFEPSFRGEASPLTCFVGYNSCAVDCFGQIFPCMPWINWAKPVGNIRETPLKEFWYSAEYNKLRTRISRCKSCFLNCQTELNLLFNTR